MYCKNEHKIYLEVDLENWMELFCFERQTQRCRELFALQDVQGNEIAFTENLPAMLQQPAVVTKAYYSYR